MICRPWSFLRRFIIHLDSAKLKTDVTSIKTIIDIDTKHFDHKQANE